MKNLAAWRPPRGEYIVTWPWVKTQIVPPVNIPIPSKIGSKMGGEYAYLNMVPLALKHCHMAAIFQNIFCNQPLEPWEDIQVVACEKHWVAFNKEKPCESRVSDSRLS